MYKVLIVDDELLAREYVKEIVNWEKLNLEVCALAKDGYDAIEKIKQFSPDIALIDIDMPTVDGLQLAEFIRENSIDIQIIVISGIDDFDTVRKSMVLQVKDYLLKPFNVEELEASLEKLVDNIHEEKYKAAIPKKNIIYNLLKDQNRYNKASFNEYFNQVAHKSCAIGVFYCRSNQGRDDFLFQLERKYEWHSAVIFIKDGEMRIICCLLDYTDTLGKQLSNEAKNTNYLYTLGPVKDNMLLLWDSYQAASDLIDDGIVYNVPRPALLSNLTKREKVFNLHHYINLEKVAFTLRTKNEEKMLGIIKNTFTKLEKDNVCAANIFLLTRTLITFCYDVLKVEGKQLFSEENIKNKSLKQIEKYVINIVTKTVGHEKNKKIPTSKKERIIYNIKNLIQENIGNSNFTINTISEALFLEKSYIRRIFKEYEDTTLNAYTIKVRCDHAKILLETGFYKHSEIAFKVGYKDAAYFSKSFKKYVGMSPKEYEIYANDIMNK